MKSPATRLSAITALLCLALPCRGETTGVGSVDAVPSILVNCSKEPVAKGAFEPTWQSLSKYEVPAWFRDAKFGIWAHWGPQCEPEQGDWYARGMYLENDWYHAYHAQHYGHQSKFGFKDVIHQWKAEKWDPDKLVALYKRVGAQYFFAMANHHDNLDLWKSRHQEWNSTRVGPGKDLIAGWAEAARRQGLPFGVSVHASHAWTWYEPSQGADKAGPLAGIPYDGKLTKADGKGTWWEGLDPQELYAQNHPVSQQIDMGKMWDWSNGATLPSQAYCDKFYNRTVDLINRYHPDLVYFDDDALPLWPVSDAGLKIAAHLYNSNMARNGGKLDAVILGKQLSDAQRKCLVWDIERGASNRIEPHPWQTDTCIGGWHYKRSLFEEGRYKTAGTVIRMLADIVSKNGNLLLNIPVRADGTIDEKEEAILEGIGAWMAVNRECIFGTRPWKVFGEGPASEGAPLSAQGFNEGKGKAFTAEDVRFTQKGDVLYAILLGSPTADVHLHSLGKASGLLDRPIRSISRLGSAETVVWKQAEGELTIRTAPQSAAQPEAVVFKISL